MYGTKPINAHMKRRYQKDQIILEANTNQLNNNAPPLPPPPSSQPNQNSNPNTNRAADSPEPIATPSTALTIRQAAVTAIYGILISGRVDNTPERGTSRGHHGNDTPVRGEVLDAPDDRDDDRREGESAAVPKANQRGRQVEDAWVC
jgi:hypothetical protein